MSWWVYTVYCPILKAGREQSKSCSKELSSYRIANLILGKLFLWWKQAYAKMQSGHKRKILSARILNKSESLLAQYVAEIVYWLVVSCKVKWCMACWQIADKLYLQIKTPFAGRACSVASGKLAADLKCVLVEVTPWNCVVVRIALLLQSLFELDYLEWDLF